LEFKLVRKKVTWLVRNAKRSYMAKLLNPSTTYLMIRIHPITNQNCLDKPFYVSPRYACLLDKYVILARMHKVLQSNQNFFLNEVLSIAITHIKTPHGGHRNIENKPFSEYLTLHNSAMINIDCEDKININNIISDMKDKI
jgi:hypothetical protein